MRPPAVGRRNESRVSHVAVMLGAALGHELRARHQDDRAVMQAVLTRFRNEKFFYTLTPPLLGTVLLEPVGAEK